MLARPARAVRRVFNQVIPAMTAVCRRSVGGAGAKLLAELRWRGLVADTTDYESLRTWLDQPRTVYCGFDPTAPSLHVGNLLALVVLRHFQRAGHRPIVVLGGATALLGDPSGRQTERELLSPETVSANLTSIRSSLDTLFDSGADARRAVLVVNNMDWHGKLSALSLLREYGKHFRLGTMLAREAVKSRLDSAEGMSYAEFSYQILQAADFAQLHARHDCSIQIGGSDQWGNMTAGIELIRRMHTSSGRPVPAVHALTLPLLTTASGAKYGKSAGNAVWLHREHTRPYDLYQFFLRTDDSELERLLKAFTSLDAAHIAALLARPPHERAAQRALARHVLSLIHGPAEVTAVERLSEAMFSDAPIAALGLTPEGLRGLAGDAPTVRLPRSLIAAATPGADWASVAAKCGLVPSKAEARRLLAAGGLYVNNERVAPAHAAVLPSQLLHGRSALLRAGKKAICLVHFDDDSAAQSSGVSSS